MADVTIDQLPPLETPEGTGVIPYSNGTTTSKATVQSLPVSWSSITGKPAIGIGGVRAFTSSGTFTVPAGVTKVRVTAIGGGGGGGGGQARTSACSSSAGGSGGTATGGDVNINGLTGSSGSHVYSPWVGYYGSGGAQYNNGCSVSGTGGSGAVSIAVVTVTPEANYSVTVGAGGGAGFGQGAGGSGGSSGFVGNDKSISAGGGGGGGANATNSNLGASGGPGTGGFVLIEW